MWPVMGIPGWEIRLLEKYGVGENIRWRSAWDK